MIRELGREPSALAVAGEYLRFIDGFVVDREDAALVDGVRSLGIDVMASQTIMRADETRASLARSVLEFARKIREARAAEIGS